MEGGTRERSSTASSLDFFMITAKRAALVEAGFPLKINTTRAKTMTTFKKVFPDMVDSGIRTKFLNACLSERLMGFLQGENEWKSCRYYKPPSLSFFFFFEKGFFYIYLIVNSSHAHAYTFRRLSIHFLFQWFVTSDDIKRMMAFSQNQS